ncbi:twin-arginine translocation pathway signal domain protein [Mycobacterium xenopi 3993]|nr:twin-arginine translocation pathway signal domain protein [Mycobacterium xenopi 3993]
MAAADLVITGTVLTVDDARPPPKRWPWPTAASSPSATDPTSAGSLAGHPDHRHRRRLCHAGIR